MARLHTLGTRVKTQDDRIRIVEPGSWRYDKSNAHQRGYNHAWRKARLEHLQAHPLCAYCEREGRVTAANVVDHSTPHRGDMALFWDRSLWVSLCTPCHSSVKQREEVEAARQGVR
ncbi:MULTISPECIES: HNH endonuclease [unclassified Pseudomonas]|uniref:HNH endonuclease n=1 Tax=unclassified Pseudomonas TaxID=196821 RepID=UPI00128DA631|nr:MULTISPECIES: HNH endonuclease [unclassified Pseudomonas]MPQ68322.1 HNH endonuclease [Pseudomonas sp. MWU12-2323]